MDVRWAAAFVVALCGVAIRADDKIEIKDIKIPALEAALAKHKGKIVVVDFWATFCLPCKKEFPNLVKLHQELGDNVICVSVTVDESEDRDAALKFLTQQKATFANYLLDEPPAKYQKHFGFGAVPCVLVFGTDGKLAKKFTADNEEFSYKDVRKLIDSLLK